MTPKRKPGRPCALASCGPMRSKLWIRLTSDEHQQLNDAAKAIGCTVSDLVRSRLNLPVTFNKPGAAPSNKRPPTDRDPERQAIAAALTRAREQGRTMSGIATLAGLSAGSVSHFAKGYGHLSDVSRAALRRILELP
jgi:hypothetical protein